MSTVLSPPTQPTVDTGRATLLRLAQRTWRRAGVRASDRQLLVAELDAEMEAAVLGQRDVVDVVGDDPAATYRDWAIERGLAGRSLRIVFSEV